MTKLSIGLDVHKVSISIGLAQAGSSEPVYHGKCSALLPNVEATLRRILKKYQANKENVRLCYEAGPSGFVLARRLNKIGYDTIVVAPSLIPTKSGDRVKTDRRDALKLARLLRAGELKGIHIPPATTEAVRDVSRARTDAVDDLRRARFRLGAFLLRNGYGWTGKTRWSLEHMRYLRELVLPDPAQKIVLEEYLVAIDSGEERVKRLDKHLELLEEKWDRAYWTKAIQGFRGFKLVGSMIIASELGDLTRFDHPRKLMGFVGLVPGEDSSGQRRRQGGITKCGNSHARWLLVEAASHYHHAPKVSRFLTKRQEGLDKEVHEISWRAQNRLYRRYIRLRKRRLNDNKIKVAIARELIAFLWELAQAVERSRNQGKAA